MKIQKRATIFFMILFLIGLIPPALLQATIYEKKADNFIILYDSSSSMDGEYLDTRKTKLDVAKSALKKLNSDIPEMEFNAGLYLFTPFTPVFQINPYDKEAFMSSIETLPEDHPYFGAFASATPLGIGIKKLDSILSGLSGKTVIYLFSDGENSDELDPLREASKLNKKHDICFNIISMAEREMSGQLLEDIAGINDCSQVVQLEVLNVDPREVSTQLYAATGGAAVALKEPEAYSPPDRDRDGIADDLDKCPNTPFGYSVDASGCRILEPLTKGKTIFEFGESFILPEKKDDLDEIGKFLSGNPNATSIVSGHTDNIGDTGYNVALSKERAISVSDYLLANFEIQKDQISLEWHGESQPIASNETAEGRQRNRRVEVIIQDAPEE